MDYTPINTVKIVIGSWGSYNACNEKSLGSKWLDLYDKDKNIVELVGMVKITFTKHLIYR